MNDPRPGAHAWALALRSAGTRPPERPRQRGEDDRPFDARGRIDAPSRGASSGVGGWLVVFCVMLVVAEPLSFALSAARLVSSLSYHSGTVAALLVVRLGVLGLGIGAGRALWRCQPQGIVLARAYLVLSTALSVLLRTTSLYPSDAAPGTALPGLALVVGVNGAWWLYLGRSARVRRTYGARSE